MDCRYNAGAAEPGNAEAEVIMRKEHRTQSTLQTTGGQAEQRAKGKAQRAKGIEHRA